MNRPSDMAAPDDEMPSEIDFSKGKRGQFYQARARLSVPVYLDEQVQNALAALASAKGVELSVLVKDLLRKDIELIELGALREPSNPVACERSKWQ